MNRWTRAVDLGGVRSDVLHPWSRGDKGGVGAQELACGYGDEVQFAHWWFGDDGPRVLILKLEGPAYQVTARDHVGRHREFCSPDIGAVIGMARALSRDIERAILGIGLTAKNRWELEKVAKLARQG